jgi:hypothetical protein
MSQSDNDAPKPQRTQRPRRIDSSPSPSLSPALSDREPDPPPSPTPLSVDAFLRARAGAKPPLKKYRKRHSTLAHTPSPPPPPRRTHRSVRRRDDDPAATAFVRHPENDAPARSTLRPATPPRRRAAASSRLPTSLADWKIGPASPPPQTSPLKASRSRRAAGGPPPLAFVPLDEHAQTYSHFRTSSSLQ